MKRRHSVHHLGLRVAIVACIGMVRATLAAYPVPEDTNAPIVAGEVTAPAAAVYSCIVIDDLLAPSNAYSRRLCAFRETSYSDGRSERVPISRGYTEVATGINYLDADGAWKQAAVEPRVMADGSVAFDKLLTRLTFAANANLDTVVTALKPDGSTIRSAVAALAYRDRASGRTAVIAVPKESQVQVVEEGVCYTNAFAGVDADILYVVNRSGLEQDIVVYGDVPPPEWFDIQRTGAVLCVMTEVLGLQDVDWAAQRPDGRTADIPEGGVVHLAIRNGSQWRSAESFRSGSAWVEDGALDIGARAARNEANARSVHMSLVAAEDHRVFLIEESPFELLEELDGFASIQEHRTAAIHRTPPRRPVERDVDLARCSSPPRWIAVNSSSGDTPTTRRSSRKLVLDYFTYSAMTNDVILEAGETYYISAPIYFDGYLYGFPTLTIAPGCYVKFHPSASITIDSGATLDCRSHLLAPALFTSVYDTNNGAEIVAGFVGDPATNRIGCALVLGSMTTMRGLEIRYADVGAQCDSNADILDSLFRHCGTAIAIDGGSSDIGNVLIQDSHIGVDITYSCSARIHGSTFDTITNSGLAMNYMAYASLTNNLFVSLTNGILKSSYPYQTSAAVNAFWNSKTNFTGVSPIALTSSPFAAGPYGSHYLYQSGSWLVNSGLQAATYWKLYHRTTSANGDKETNSTADIGFHYGTTNDVDGDGVADFIEDTSGDGSFDLADVSDLGDADTDDDSLSDGLEYFTYYTGPRTQDTDGDGAWDGAEVDAGTDPLDSNSVPISIAGTISYSGGQTGLIHLRAAEVETGLVFHYPFDVDQGTNVMDASGCGHHGVVTGAVHVTNGYRGGAYYFDGTGDYIRVTNSSLDGASRFTLAAWVKASLSNSPDPANGLFGKHRAGNNYHSFWIFQEGTNLRAQLWGPNWTPANIITSMTSFAAAWTHVAITYDGATFSVFTNGSLVAAQSMPGYTGNTHALMIGAGEYKVGTSTPDRFWRGFIDEVKGYNRALGPEEISHLWSTGTTAVKVFATNMPSPGPYTLSGLHAYRSYDVDAYRDSNTNLVLDGSEASGVYSGNSFYASASQSNMNVTLIDPDSDGDTLPDWWEAKYGLSTSDGAGVNGPAGDPDEDGISNLDEYNAGTDPTDKYSVPPPSMLRVSGKYIVDEQTNKVVLKSVNIGGWLSYEQWMLGFEPSAFKFTNHLNEVITNDYPHGTNEMDQATLAEMLISNVDFSVFRFAVSNNGSSGTDIQPDSGRQFVGGLDANDWICFSNVNFGTGVSNLSAALAIKYECEGKYVDLKLGNPYTGTTVCTIRVEGTDSNNWYTLGQQTVSGFSLSGTQTIYFVGRGGGCIANLFTFWFYRDPNTAALLETFRNSYFTTNELDRLKALGYNSIRLPFPYDLIQDNTGTNYLSAGWNRLDNVIDECSKRRMWCILDLHAAPGGQNGFDHGGQTKGLRNKLWSNLHNQERLTNLWQAVAARYRTNTTVAGYDIFNEPDAPGNTGKVGIYTNSILPLLDRAYKAVRSTDSWHVVFMMSNFQDQDTYTNIWYCPSPASRGWSNVVYEFHHYDRVHYGKTETNDFEFEAQKDVADTIIRAYTQFSDHKQVPVFIGEFNPIREPNHDYFMRRLCANGISWAVWNFRHWGHDDSGHPWSSWGLDYRNGGIYQGTNSAIQPNVRADNYTTLSAKMAAYTFTNYTAHPFLPKVVRNNARNTNAASARAEFYLNTFSAPLALTLTDPIAWPWKKVAAVGSTNLFNYEIVNQRAQLYVGQGPLLLRAKAREEADARFEINDATGCWFSVDSTTFNVTNNQAGYDAAINLCVVRDEITNKTYAYDTEGVIARLEYDLSGDAARITVYGKNGGANTNGIQLQEVSGIGYVSGATLQMFVNRTNAILNYNGSNVWSGAHGVNLSTWADGAVCIVEAEQVITNTTQYAEFDNVKAERPNTVKGITYGDDFANYATGIVARAEPEFLALRRWTNAASGDSIMTNSALVWIPQSVTNGGSWYGPRRDYQNDVRLDLSGTTVAEVQVTYDSFSSSNFQAMIAMMPEYFTGEISNQYVGTALYLEIALRMPGETNAGNLAFSVWRHTGPGTRDNVAVNDSLTFVSNQVVSFQVSTNRCQVYYGTNVSIDSLHGLTNAAQLYANGVYPHLELKNRNTSVNLTGEIGGVLFRNKSGFDPP